MSKPIHFRKTLCFALMCIISVAVGFAMPGDTFADDPPLQRMVSIQYDGGIRPSVEDPQGRMSGINLATQAVEYGIPDTEIFFGTDNGSIKLNTLVDGTYTVSVYGIYEEDYKIEIIYMDENEKMMDVEFQGFHHKDKDITPFTFTLDEDNLETPLAINLPVPSPHDLLADPVEDQGLKTKLTWSASTDSEVIGYNIYYQSQQKPFFTKLGQSTDNQYQTNHAWSADAATASTRYAVTAIKQDGTESFFSNVETNNDRDHDWLTDEKETELGTDLNNPDTDGDLLTDFQEYNNYHTDPVSPDTDGDTYTDGEEIQAGSNPRDSNSIPENCTPGIEIIQPDGVSDIADTSYAITWTDHDSDDDAQIALYYDTDNMDQNGTLIVENLSEDDEADFYAWDTTQIPEGNYFIYAVISDQSNEPVVVYSSGFVTIDKTECTVVGTNAESAITLAEGWNVFSTPRVLESINFSNEGTEVHFYKLEGGAWGEMTTTATTANIKPLEGFMINNASGDKVYICLDYKKGLTSGQKLFTKSLDAGWNIVGVANQSFDADDSNYGNVSIKDALFGLAATGSIIDYTTSNFAVGDFDNKVDSSGEIFSKEAAMDDSKFEEFKAYLVSIQQGGATYGGSQKNNEDEDEDER